MHVSSRCDNTLHRTKTTNKTTKRTEVWWGEVDENSRTTQNVHANSAIRISAYSRVRGVMKRTKEHRQAGQSCFIELAWRKTLGQSRNQVQSQSYSAQSCGLSALRAAEH
jgi:hypothetical protein